MKQALSNKKKKKTSAELSGNSCCKTLLAWKIRIHRIMAYPLFSTRFFRFEEVICLILMSRYIHTIYSLNLGHLDLFVR